MENPVILCVDDEKAILELLERQLEQRFGENFDIEIAESGEEALEIIEELNDERRILAVVVSDMIMPGIKGDELLACIQESNPDTPKILLTGQADLEAVIAAVNKAQLFRYIPKPWEPNDMNLTIEQATRSFLQAKEIVRASEYNDLLEKLNADMQRLSGVVSFEELLQVYMETARTNSRADRIYVLLDNPNEAKYPGADAGKLYKIERGSIELVNALLPKARAFIQQRENLIETANASEMILPLTKGEGGGFGYALLEHYDEKEVFEQRHLKIMQMLTAQFARALELSALYSSLEEKNVNIMDSIRYARRIQLGIMPPRETLQDLLPDSAVFYRSKDVVSGDFYWWTKVEDKIIVAVVDCTGHGVPGAFMSVIGSNALNQIVRDYKITAPDLILQYLNQSVLRALGRNNPERDYMSKDGMDVGLLMIDKTKKNVDFAGARRPLYLLRSGEVIEFKSDKFSIGETTEEGEEPNFTSKRIPAQDDDLFVLFTDGITDQFGGPNHRKFMPRRLRETIAANVEQPAEDVVRSVKETLIEWQDGYEQTDDMLAMALRIR